MTPGERVRRLLGDGIFARVVEVYRAIFVDLDEVAACIPHLPAGSELLDVGGGDGALLNRILGRQPQLWATLVDQRASVGLSLSPAHRRRVRLLPATAVRDVAMRGAPPPTVVVVADVLHHVRVGERSALLREIRELGVPELLVVKDVAPEGWRAWLGRLSDIYITGDRHVALLTPGDVKQLVREVFPELLARDTPLLERDAPNYCIVFERDSRSDAASPESGSDELETLALRRER